MRRISSLSLAVLSSVTLTACPDRAKTPDASLPHSVAQDAQSAVDARAARPARPRTEPSHGLHADASAPTTAPTEWAELRPTAVDLDHDGVQDWTAQINSAHGVVATLTAHGRADGTVALDDELTRVRLRAQCPVAPRSLFVFDPESMGENEPIPLLRRVFCARVWGMSESAARAMIAWGRAEGVPASREVEESARWADAGTAPDATSATLAEFTPPWAELDAMAARAAPLVLTVSAPPAFRWPAPAASSGDAGAADASASTAATNALSPALRALCQQVEGRARSFVDGVIAEQRDASAPYITDSAGFSRQIMGSVGRCIPTAGGAWAIQFTRTLTRNNPDAAREGKYVEYEIELYDTEAQRVARAAPGYLLYGECDHDELEVFGTSDYDRDGKGELLLRSVHFWCGDGDGDTPDALRVLSAREGHVRPYGRMMSVRRVDRAVDLDGDGLLDLLDDSSTGTTSCDPHEVGADDHPVWTFAVHARPDGTFSYNDAITQQYQRDRCAALSREWIASDADTRALDGESMLGRALCARMAGWSAERVQLSILDAVRRRGARSIGFRCNDFNWLTTQLLHPLPLASVRGTMR